MRTKLLAVCLIAMLAASCNAGRAVDAWCLTNAPQRPSAAEIAVMTTERVKAVLSHNRLGQSRCGWSAK